MWWLDIILECPDKVGYNQSSDLSSISVEDMYLLVDYMFPCADMVIGWEYLVGKMGIYDHCKGIFSWLNCVINVVV